MKDIKTLLTASALAIVVAASAPAFANEQKPQEKHAHKEGDHKDDGKHAGHKEGDDHDHKDGDDHGKEKAEKPAAKSAGH